MPKPTPALVIHALVLSLSLLAFYVFCFAVSDRQLIFLYDHLGYGHLADFNLSRHWMTGLVVGGLLLISYLPLNLIIQKLYKKYQFPDWANLSCYVCLFLSPPLFFLLNFIVQPVLPFLLNLTIFLILFLSVRLVLYLTHLALKNFKDFFWLTLDAWSLLPVLFILPILTQYGLKRSFPPFGLFVLSPLVMMLLVGLGFTLITWLTKRVKRTPPGSLQLFLSALSSAYLFFPFLHYFSSNPGGTLYISNSDNFFANNPLIQIASYILVLVLLKVFNKWRGQEQSDDFKATLKLFLLLLGLVLYIFGLRQFLTT